MPFLFRPPQCLYFKNIYILLSYGHIHTWYVFVCMPALNVCGGRRTTLWSGFSTTFIWVVVMKLLVSLDSKHLYLLNDFSSLFLSICFVFCDVCFETGTRYAAPVGHELRILFFLSLCKNWDYVLSHHTLLCSRFLRDKNVLASFLLLRQNTPTKKQLGKERIDLVTLPGSSRSITDSSQGRSPSRNFQVMVHHWQQSEQESKQELEAETTEEHCLPWFMSSYLSNVAQDHLPREWCYPQWDGYFSVNKQLKQFFKEAPYRIIWSK